MKLKYVILFLMLFGVDNQPNQVLPHVRRTTDTLWLRDTIFIYDTVFTKRDTVIDFVNYIVKDTVVTKTTKVRLSNKSVYSVAAWFTKIHEGYRSDIYNCVAGYETIGWGHLWKKGEPKVVDLKAANLMFRDDFQKKFDKSNWHPDLLYHERLAITMLTFQVGLSNYKKTGLYKYIVKHIEDGQVSGGIRHSKWENRLKRKWLAYVNYKDPKTGKFIAHPRFKERRSFEVSLFLEGERFAMTHYETTKKVLEKKLVVYTKK